MHKEITYDWLADKCICALLVLSMLSTARIEVAGFPLYSLLLLVIASVWLICRIIYAGREDTVFPTVRYMTDTAAIVAILYAIFSVIVKLFDTSGEGWIDFSWNAEVIALAVICLLVSSGIEFKIFYLDLLSYSGLLAAGLYLLGSIEGGIRSSIIESFLTHSAGVSSYFLLVGMVSVYAYCVCRDKMRSVFYLMVSGISFLVLFLNHNIISLWLMGIYFLAVPVMLRPTAILVKRIMQLFFVYLFMLSNMSLLTEYTQFIQSEISYSLEHSVYIDLLVVAGGLVFFHYWDRIPEGMDLERLVLRKMQKAYRFVLTTVILVFMVVILGGDWAALPEGISYDMVKSFAVPLAEAVGRNESGILQCFRTIGVLPGIFLIVSIVLFTGRMHRNYASDKPVTAILILISGIFQIQLLFWNPGIHNIVCYFYLLATACFYKEEREQMESVGIKISDLKLKVQEIQL